MREELRALVPLKLNAEKGGQALAEKYQVDGYPTLVFATATGEEVDRVSGYLPPGEFLAEVRRIRRGDTFASTVRQLDADPTNADLLRRVVKGLLARSDNAHALVHLEAYRAMAGEEAARACADLLLRANAALQEDVYRKAGQRFRDSWSESLDLPAGAAGLRLAALISDGLAQLSEQEQARKLREARRLDAGDLVQTLPQAELETDDLVALADFAFGAGHYEVAGDLYQRWYGAEGESAEAGQLNGVAWNLYQAGQRLDLALEMARKAAAEDPSADTADTLARLLYVTGAAQEAIAVEERAAGAAEGDHAGEFLKAVATMRRGEKLDDAPAFASYPGKRKASVDP